MLDTMSNIHDTDFYTWARQQASLLRQGRFTELDLTNLVAEIEDMGVNEQHELENRLVVLLSHLLKWCYLPGRRSRSWYTAIRLERLKARNVLLNNPGLQNLLTECVTNAYAEARYDAMLETNLAEETFPLTCSWTPEQLLHNDFLPPDPIVMPTTA